jgi:hypothetical protein
MRSLVLQTIANSPTNFMTTVRGLDAPITTLVVGLASNVLVPLLSGVRNTLTDAVDVPELVRNAKCVANGIVSSLPDTSVLVSFVDEVCCYRCSPSPSLSFPLLPR